MVSIYTDLSQGREILVTLNAYPFSKKYRWINDRYGVSWQLILADTWLLCWSLWGYQDELWVVP
ncbi:VOC family protein [Leptolyngbya sp. BC1307]|uniref:VOC family protein n=1 Tax=Leptolyngbya sp. BC1307 TaxID=2029589 RepID=UPI000EFC8A79